MGRNIVHRSGHAAIVGLLVCCCALAAAQEKPSREKEALRRTQLALRAAQEKQTALQVERDKLATSLSKADRQRVAEGAELDTARRQLRSARDATERSSEALASMRAEWEAMKRAAADDRQKHETELQALRSQVLDTRRQLAERTASNTAVVRLLEQSVSSLEKAEDANRQLQQVGGELLQAYRDKGVIDAAVQSDPVLGFGDVRIENRAQDFRARMAKLKLQPSKPTSGD